MHDIAWSVLKAPLNPNQPEIQISKKWKAVSDTVGLHVVFHFNYFSAEPINEWNFMKYSVIGMRLMSHSHHVMKNSGYVVVKTAEHW